jgi:pyruvate dehydrogenase E2 component (dihydrolipoamide acetyltransferase)
MPSLGADMDAGRLTAWRVRPGDRVARGDIVALVETDKAEIEVEVFESGVVEELLVAPGERVPVGTVLARLRAEGAEPALAAPPASAAPPRPPAAPAPGPPAPTPAAGASPPPAARERLRATPLARRRARELGVDLRAAPGSGAGGAVTLADVERLAQGAAARRTAAPAAAPEPAPSPRRPAERRAGMRRAIAAAMERSKREIPHYYLETRIDMSRALAWLEQRNRELPVAERLLPAALLLRATALALREAPELNGFWLEGAFRPAEGVHLGVAVSLRGGGLIAPVLRDADGGSLRQLMAALREAVNRARRGTLRSSELGGASATVTNLGEQGVEKVFGVIHPPQVALVGFGRVGEQPWAEQGLVGVRRVVTATLSADHRASDGQRGARFLNALAARLGAPETL